MAQEADTKGAFHLTKTFGLNLGTWFEISNVKWYSISQNFRKRGQPQEIFPQFSNTSYQEFQFHFILLLEFLEFPLNGSHFGNSTICRFSENAPWKFPYHQLRFEHSKILDEMESTLNS